jgi:hypothetical protein
VVQEKGKRLFPFDYIYYSTHTHTSPFWFCLDSIPVWGERSLFPFYLLFISIQHSFFIHLLGFDFISIFLKLKWIIDWSSDLL